MRKYCVSMAVYIRIMKMILFRLWALATVVVFLSSAHVFAAEACDHPTNEIVAENCKTGNPASEWDIQGIGDKSIQGFASDISFNKGERVDFKIRSNDQNYKINIYRLGFYGGLGARKIATVTPSAYNSQAPCLSDITTHLVDCGNWTVSASWQVPDEAVSGVYLAKLTKLYTGGSSHIIFIVRNDKGHSDLLFQTSDTTWQAYNNYGGFSLYNGATKVSYNRPFYTRAAATSTWFFSAEYAMVRFLEANGYDVSYFSGVDTHRYGTLLLSHKVFLSVGHDEYWSANQRANVENARNTGVNLGFFSGNEMFWKARWENSIDSTGTQNRTLVTYKETQANAKIDPVQDVWTGTWRDPRFSQDGGKPENSLSGTMFDSNGTRNDPISVPVAFRQMRFWRNTDIATLPPSAEITLPVGILGYEWDSVEDNGCSPAGLVKFSSTTIDVSPSLLIDYGSTYGNGYAEHNLTLYKHASGSLVFSAGTINWSFGLDSTHDTAGPTLVPTDVRMMQATINLFADMGVQPTTLKSGLVQSSKSADVIPPSSAIIPPTKNAMLTVNSPITISGVASDIGGVVGGVEVSMDDGNTWHMATGRESWSYLWTPQNIGSATIKSRAVDDSGNLEHPRAGMVIDISDIVKEADKD